MPDFAYVARDAAGARLEGVVAAATEREAIAALSQRQLFPTQVKAVAGQAATGASLARFRPQVMSQFYLQLAALLRSGVPLLRSLEVLRQQSSQPALKQVVDDLHARITEGDSLADAMARHPRAFTELARSVLRAGTEGGFLEDALDRVAKFTDQEAELKARVWGAMAYPIFLSVFGTLIVAALIVFFVPRFETLFGRLRERGELPWATDALLGASRGLRQYGWLLALGLASAFALFLQWRQSAGSRRQLDHWRLRVPQAGQIYRNLAVARFCRVLGTLLAGGVPIVRSLRISADATGNVILAEAIGAAAENLSAGESLASPLAASGQFPPNVLEMISVAEQSNTLETVLVGVADSLEKETWRRLDLLVRLLEPIMLLIMASGVLVIVVALMLPLLKSATAV